MWSVRGARRRVSGARRDSVCGVCATRGRVSGARRVSGAWKGERRSVSVFAQPPPSNSSPHQLRAKAEKEFIELLQRASGDTLWLFYNALMADLSEQLQVRVLAMERGSLSLTHIGTAREF